MINNTKKLPQVQIKYKKRIKTTKRYLLMKCLQKKYPPKKRKRNKSDNDIKFSFIYVHIYF